MSNSTSLTNQGQRHADSKTRQRFLTGRAAQFPPDTVIFRRVWRNLAHVEQRSRARIALRLPITRSVSSRLLVVAIADRLMFVSRKSVTAGFPKVCGSRICSKHSQAAAKRDSISVWHLRGRGLKSKAKVEIGGTPQPIGELSKPSADMTAYRGSTENHWTYQCLRRKSGRW